MGEMGAPVMGSEGGSGGGGGADRGPLWLLLFTAAPLKLVGVKVCGRVGEIGV